MKDDLIAYLDRRQLLRYCGQFAVLLPFYRALLSTKAVAAPPSRILCCYFPNGVHRPSFTPSGSGSVMTFPEVSKPLSGLASDLLFIQGMDRAVDGSHEVGAMNLYTGCASWAEVKALGQGSIFNYIAEKLGGQSVNLGVASSLWGNNFDKTVNFNKDGTAGLVEDNPEAAFARLYGGSLAAKGAASTQQTEALKAARKSILDANMADIAALKLRVGGEEKRKLEQHLEELRALEKKIGGSSQEVCEGSPDLLGGLKVPANDKGYPKFVQRDENFGRISKIMMDLMVQALACGATRVGFLQWSCTVSPIAMTFEGGPGVAGSHHDVSHYGGAPASYNKNQTWYMGQFAYLISQLKNQKEGDASLLDSLFGMAGTCINDGDQHGHQDMPYFLFGKANGAIKPGRVVTINKAHNALLISMLQSVGINETTYGNKGFAQGPASEIG